MSKKNLSGQLLEDLVASFNETLEEKGMFIPEIFTGINIENRQFFINMSDVQLDAGQRPDFMRYVLFYEKSIAFAFKMRTQSLVTEEPEVLREEHMFLSGEENSYHSVVLTHKLESNWDEGSKKIHESHTTEPEIFFQDLFGKTSMNTDEDKLFKEIWNSVQDKVKWIQREEAKNMTFFQRYKNFFWKSYIIFVCIHFVLTIGYWVVEYW